MACTVQRLPLIIWAFPRRSSIPPRLLVLPEAETAKGLAVDGTVMLMVDDIVGVVPGVVMTRIRKIPKKVTSGPMKYPCVALESMFVTPSGENMLAELVPIRRKAVTVSVPVNRLALLI